MFWGTCMICFSWSYSTCSPSEKQCIYNGTHSGKVWLVPQFHEISIDSSSAFDISRPAPGHYPSDSLSREMPCSNKSGCFPQFSVLSLDLSLNEDCLIRQFHLLSFISELFWHIQKYHLHIFEKHTI